MNEFLADLKIQINIFIVNVMVCITIMAARELQNLVDLGQIILH